MATIKKVADKPSFPELETKITAFWKEHQIFEKSVEQRSETETYRFVDGPPFVTGIPHYGSLLPSIAKDIIPRYWAMKGKRVRRVWGWDCHGLPIEQKVSQKLGVSTKKEIQELGVDTYIQACKEYIASCTSDWRWYIEKIGRWVDLDHAYYTMSPEYMESVMWGFKQIYEKGLIYKGKRVSMYSTDTATPVSQFEVAMDTDNYKEVQDLSVFVKFQLKESNAFVKTLGNDSVFFLAWTTTPWTIPANFALAVNPDATYVHVMYDGVHFIVAKERLEYTFHVDATQIGDSPDMLVQILHAFPGKQLEGVTYHPVYNFFADEATENDYTMYLSDDVVLTEGTGGLHIAPAFGEVDFNFGKLHNLSDKAHIDEEGRLLLGEWKGMYLRDASPLVAEDMEKKGALFRSEVYTHRLPFYRGTNPLIYMAQDAYFIDIQKIKDRMLALNTDINWIPEHIREGRFAKTVATSPDWCISRNRFWATIMPIWRSESGNEIIIGSMEEFLPLTKQVTKVDGKYLFEGMPLDLHKDVADKIILTKDGEVYTRVPEVLDCWMDSGSVPFAEYHYPFENKEVFEQQIEADYIIEYIGQVRAWFNVLLRISTMIFDDTAFRNVICTGVLAGNDGRKMSKSFGNYPDPKDVLENIGGEALRLYLMGSSIMNGDDMNWSDEILKDQTKNILLPIWNTYKYLGIYASLHNWQPETTEFTSSAVLDVWMKTYMDSITKQYAEKLESYNIPGSVKLIQECIDTISSWYIRRSRDRFAKNDTNALQTLYATLVQFIKTFAPQLPFVTEALYQGLVVEPDIARAKESVHLEDYPIVGEVNEKLLEQMDVVRFLCSLGQSIRVENGLKVRQPLTAAFVSLEDPALQLIIKEELNVETVTFVHTAIGDAGFLTKEDELNGKKYFITIDTNLSESLKQEGMINDITRHIQNLRKSEKFSMTDKVSITYCSEDEALVSVMKTAEERIAKTVNAVSLTQKLLQQGHTLTINGHTLLIALLKENV